MTLIDVHAHLNDLRYCDRVSEVVSDFEKDGGSLIINSGFDVQSSEIAARQSEEYEKVYFSAGVHPDEAKTFDRIAEDKLIELVRRKKCVAVGEIGFDFHNNKSSEEEQYAAFERQMEIADAEKKPFVVHSRDAFQKTVDFLNDRRGLIKRGFLMHCYAGSAEGVKAIADLGGYFSFGGVITFKNAKRESALLAVPQDRLLTETDCPYLTPEPFRGQENSPSNIKYVLKKMALIRCEDEEITARLIAENSKRLFGV